MHSAGSGSSTSCPHDVNMAYSNVRLSFLHCGDTAPEAFASALPGAAAVSVFSDASVSSSPDLSASINFFLQRSHQHRFLMQDI